MRFEGTYYIAKPIRQAMDRKANGEEPFVELEITDRLSVHVDLVSETGEMADYSYYIEPTPDKTGWEFFQYLNLDAKIVFSSHEPASLDKTMVICAEGHEFVIHFVEFMSDYNDKDFSYLQECFRNAMRSSFQYPPAEEMMEIVDKWHQGRFSEFMHARELYRTTCDREDERWAEKHGIKIREFASCTKFDRSKRYLISEDFLSDEKILKEVFFNLMYDVFVYEWLYFLRTDPREVLKREVSRWHNRYDTYFQRKIACKNTRWMPFPLSLGELEYVHETKKRESETTPKDLVSNEELQDLIECYKELYEAEEKIANKRRGK